MSSSDGLATMFVPVTEIDGRAALHSSGIIDSLIDVKDYYHSSISSLSKIELAF